MSLWHIAWNYLWARKLTTTLTIVSVALGVALISAVLILRDETERRFVEEGQAFDIVIGRESPLQLTLSSVYFMDRPTPNVPYSAYERVKSDPDVKAAFPIAMGDTYKGNYIVCTEPGLLEYTYEHPVTGELKEPYRFADGRNFEKPLEAVLGAEVAETSGLRIGDTFPGEHGSGTGDIHDDTPYEVVGILKRSGAPSDRVIFASIDSQWMVHDHEEGVEVHPDPEDDDHGAHDDAHDDHDEHEAHEDVQQDREVTAIIAALETPGLRFKFRQDMGEELGLTVAVPIIQIQNLYDQLLGTARMVLLAIGYLVVIISSISILIGLYMSIQQRSKDFAIMRALGAARGEILGAVIIEAFWVTLLGIIAGWFTGVAATYGLSQFLVDRIGFTVTVYRPSPDMITAYSVVLLVGMLAGIVPAIQAYRTDIARNLADL